MGEICARVTRKNKNGESDLPLTIASQYGLIDQRDFFSKVVAAKDMSNYYLLNKGEFAYNKSYSNGFDYGSIKRLNAYEKGCLSTLYICFGITSDAVESDYLECYFDTLKWYDDVAMICAEGARNHGLLNVNTTGFFDEVSVVIPTSKEEQRKISRCLNNLDNLITLHQRKCDETKELKKYMLQKMFPKNGEKKPEIRFSGFTDDWEQRKLENLGEIVTGSTPSTSKEEYYSEDGIPWVTPTDISENIVYDTPRKLSKEGQKVGRVVPKDTILVTCIASIGKNTMLGTTGSFNQQINGLVPDFDKYNPYFLFTESALWSEKMKKQAAAGTMQIVNKTEFSELDTMVPKLEEQEKIGTYFRNLDNLITLHQRKCDILKETKKYMLQNMFPQKG